MALWQKVYEDNQLYRAEIVRAVLDDRGLDPVLINKQDTAYKFGNIEVRVAPDNVIKALKIIKEEISFE
jgi:hypothetical protein